MFCGQPPERERRGGAWAEGRRLEGAAGEGLGRDFARVREGCGEGLGRWRQRVPVAVNKYGPRGNCGQVLGDTIGLGEAFPLGWVRIIRGAPTVQANVFFLQIIEKERLVIGLNFHKFFAGDFPGKNHGGWAGVVNGL